MDDPLFLCGTDLPRIDPQSDAVFLAQVTEDGLLICAGRVLPKRPHATVGIPANEVVGHKLDHRWRDHVQKLLDLDLLSLGSGFLFVVFQ